MRSNILSKLIFASCVWYSDRAYYGYLCAFRLPGAVGMFLLVCMYGLWQRLCGNTFPKDKGGVLSPYGTRHLNIEIPFHVPMDFSLPYNTDINICIYVVFGIISSFSSHFNISCTSLIAKEARHLNDVSQRHVVFEKRMPCILSEGKPNNNQRAMKQQNRIIIKEPENNNDISRLLALAATVKILCSLYWAGGVSRKTLVVVETMFQHHQRGAFLSPMH